MSGRKERGGGGLHVDIIGMYHSSRKVRVHNAKGFIGARSFAGIFRYGPRGTCRNPGLTVTILWGMGGEGGIAYQVHGVIHATGEKVATRMVECLGYRQPIACFELELCLQCSEPFPCGPRRRG
jgi:hypothetical protein